jgi:hypothetical protein
MKKLAVVFLVFSVLFSGISVSAAKEIVSLKDGTLEISEIITKTIIKAIIPNVPRQIKDSKIAWQLVKGKIKSYPFEIETGNQLLISFPIKERATFTKGNVSYNKDWIVSESISFYQVSPCWFITVAWLIIPAIVIFVVIAGLFLKNKEKNTFIFFVVFFLSVIISALLGEKTASEEFILSTSVFVGASMFIYLIFIEDSVVLGFVGFLMGILSGFTTYTIGNRGELALINAYLGFLILIFTISFFVNRALFKKNTA